MKKILLTTAALVAFGTVPAMASEPALQLGLGGYIAGYGIYTDQDEPAGVSYRSFDFRKDTEVHLTGEVALDNGVTAGAHMEILSDRFDNSGIEESYMYLSSSWGRVNFGEEDGIAYLIQVAPPTADENVDGPTASIGTFAPEVGGTLTYGQRPFGNTNKLTYVTPVFNGFQAGVSYTPTVGAVNTPTLVALGFAGATGSDLNGTAAAETRDDTDDFENGWEIAARYEGSFEMVDVMLGAGYSAATLEETDGGVFFNDDFTMWNVGAHATIDQFGFGAAYLTSNNGLDGDFALKGIVVGTDYTTGPYKVGLNYVDVNQETGAGSDDAEIQRWTAGALYEWGPGMTFRGAVQWQELDDGADTVDGTQVTLGTQLTF